MLRWRDDEHFVIGETAFRAMPEGVLEPPEVGEDEFLILKPRSLVERHAALVEELKPQRIFELGFYGGGSTLFLAEVARPRKLVAVDRLRLDQNRKRVDRAAASRGLAEAVRILGEVDQSDRRRLAEIVEGEFDDQLDLVIDDCSHLYGPTRASFNELFPRLRPGGVYVIEDWRWAHAPVGVEPPEGLFPEEIPLTRLLFEIVLALPGIPGLITEVTIEGQLALIRRGEASVDASAFDVAASSNPRGRALLASA
jgi:SAM-dependent methyltransferase